MSTPAATIKPSIFLTSMSVGNLEGSMNWESPSVSLAVPLGADQDLNVIVGLGTGIIFFKPFSLDDTGWGC